MNFRSLKPAFIFLFLPLALARADQQVVTANELSKLLTNNTIEGTWLGNPYRQFFNADGSTIYAPKSSASTLGDWRLHYEKNLYESWWRRSGWSSYQVVEQDGQFFWHSDREGLQPFKILPGQQLVWDE